MKRIAPRKFQFRFSHLAIWVAWFALSALFFSLGSIGWKVVSVVWLFGGLGYGVGVFFDLDLLDSALFGLAIGVIVTFLVGILLAYLLGAAWNVD